MNPNSLREVARDYPNEEFGLVSADHAITYPASQGQLSRSASSASEPLTFPRRTQRQTHCQGDVIAHLSCLVGAKVAVTLEVEAEIPTGAPDHVVRTVTENSRTLKFSSQGFEKD